MTISDPEFATQVVFLDTYEEIVFDDSESFNLVLRDTLGLTLFVDSFRESMGLLPMQPSFEHASDYDQNGWYDFYIYINKKDLDMTGSSIIAIVHSDDADDDLDDYEIALSDDVRKALYQHLDAEAKKAFGYGFDKLLAEAREYAERP